MHKTKSRDWWNEIKQLCGSSKIANKDLQMSLHPDLKFEDQELCEQLNKTFKISLENYTLLSRNVSLFIAQLMYLNL